jgi:hypothetical protein
VFIAGLRGIELIFADNLDSDFFREFYMRLLVVRRTPYRRMKPAEVGF